jgi:hypothetical protein
VPHPDSPAGVRYSWQVELLRLVIEERARAVGDAFDSALRYTPHAIYEATGQELHEMVGGLIPGLLMLLGVLAGTTTLGAVLGALIGAAIGALMGAPAFGVGAIPAAYAGAVGGGELGAQLGFEAGIALLEYMGLAFLIAYIGKRLLQAGEVAGQAVIMAWGSVDNRRTQPIVIDGAAHRLAFAVALVFRGVLQGIIAFLLAKGTAAAASRVPELVARLRASKLGAGFAEWIEKNWSRLLKEEKLKEEIGEGDEGALSDEAEKAAAEKAAAEKAAKEAAERAAAEKAAEEAKERARKEAEEKAAAEKAAREKAESYPGHGHGRHGSQTTIAGQTRRVQTGVAPDGPKAPTSKATKFDSDAKEVEAVERAKAKNPGANKQKFKPKGKPNRDSVTVDDGPEGYGSGVEVQTGADGKPLPGRPVQPTGQQQNATVVFEYNPKTNQWEPLTQYPSDDPVSP